MRIKNLTVSLIAVLTLCGMTSASALVITVGFTEAGWYNQDGFHDQTNPSYIAGEIVVPNDGSFTDGFFNDFFTFNLPAISDLIVGAQLRIFNPVFFSGDPTETLGIFDVSTPAAALGPSTSGAVGVFTDLGSGTSYGSQVVSAADDGMYVIIDLNQAALDALNAAGPGLFAFGGALTTLNSSPATEFVFAGTENPLSRDAQLILTTRPDDGAAPEPSSLLLLAAGVAAALRAGRRKRA
jgi:PEP-CTERM motif-containing protein